MRDRRTDPANRKAAPSKALQNRLRRLYSARKGTAHEGRIAGGCRGFAGQEQPVIEHLSEDATPTIAARAGNAVCAKRIRIMPPGGRSAALKRRLHPPGRGRNHFGLYFAMRNNKMRTAPRRA